MKKQIKNKRYYPPGSKVIAEFKIERKPWVIMKTKEKVYFAVCFASHGHGVPTYYTRLF